MFVFWGVFCCCFVGGLFLFVYFIVCVCVCVCVCVIRERRFDIRNSYRESSLGVWFDIRNSYRVIARRLV